MGEWREDGHRWKAWTSGGTGRADIKFFDSLLIEKFGHGKGFVHSSFIRQQKQRLNKLDWADILVS